MDIWATNFWQGQQEHTMGKKIVSSIKDVGDIHMQKIETRP